MVQNPPRWRASHALGHPKQRKFKFNWMKSLCFGCPSAQLALQHGGFCTMLPSAVKDPLSLLLTLPLSSPQEASMYPLRMRLLLHQQQLESMRQQHQVLINKHQNSIDSTKARLGETLDITSNNQRLWSAFDDLDLRLSLSLL